MEYLRAVVRQGKTIRKWLSRSELFHQIQRGMEEEEGRSMIWVPLNIDVQKRGPQPHTNSCRSQVERRKGAQCWKAPQLPKPDCSWTRMRQPLSRLYVDSHV
jgi:hypothetical protein